MPAKLLTDNLMLMKGHLSLKSMAAVAVCTACLSGPSLAAAKWADCTRPPNPKGITSNYKVELKTGSDKVSIIRNTVVKQELLHPRLKSDSAEVQFIARANWFPSEIVIGPLKAHPSIYYSESGNVVRSGTYTPWIKISRETLEWTEGSTRGGVEPGERDWHNTLGTCRIIPNPVQTLF